MLARENRLKKSQDFQNTFKKGTGFSLGSFRIKVLDKKNAMPTRIGFIVSNKCDKRASKRNSVKRLMRAETLGLISELKSGYDVVVSLQNKIETPILRDKLRLELIAIYKKAGIVK